MRTHHDLFTALLDAIPDREELAALSDEQIESLRKVGNSYDNALYLEILRRRDAAK